MKRSVTSYLVIMLAAALMAACSRKPDPNLQIRQAVAQTLAAIPAPTNAPFPTPHPSPTPFSLAGLFCEYRFCIGHPVDMAFFDVSAQQNPGAPSAYTQGILVAYNANLFLQVMWQISPGTSDPGFLIDLILEPGIDTPNGGRDSKQIGTISALYMPINSTASPLLPYGGAGGWTCGDRVFAWKAYTPDTVSAEALFNDAASRFACQ